MQCDGPRSAGLLGLNCVTLGKSLTLSVLQSPFANESNTYLTGLLWGLIRENVCKAFKVLEEGAI